jgi:hypothetical protein
VGTLGIHVCARRGGPISIVAGLGGVTFSGPADAPEEPGLIGWPAMAREDALHLMEMKFAARYQLLDLEIN